MIFINDLSMRQRFKSAKIKLPIYFLIIAVLPEKITNLTLLDKTFRFNCMTQEKLKVYKSALEKERSLILSEIKAAEKTPDFGSDIDHFDEKTDEAEQLGDQLAIAQDLKKRLDDIVFALAKIPTGKYGICEVCGKEIEEEILDIDPESRLCKNDKLKK
jgi:DnaK suppressor protein